MPDTPTWDNAAAVRVQEHLYTEFINKSRVFTDNPRRGYVRKVYDIDQKLGEYIRLRGLAGNYHISLFHILKIESESNIFKYVHALYREAGQERGWDRHNQDVNFIMHNDNMCPYEIIEKGRGEGLDYNSAEEKSCFSGLSNTLQKNATKYKYMTGYFVCTVHITGSRTQKWVDILNSQGILDDIAVWFEGRVLFYRVLINNGKMRYDRLYFALSCLRFLKEYHGSVNITIDIINELKLHPITAMLLAFHFQPSTRWLHVPWTTSHMREASMVSFLQYTLAIRSFMQTSLYSKSEINFKSSNRIEDLKDRQAFLLFPGKEDHVSNLKRYNKIAGGDYV